MSKVILYKGRRGAGKTLSMVKDGYQYHLNGWEVYRNFKCSFGKYMGEDKILKLNKKSKIKNCVIMMDELQIFFDARRSMKEENVTFSNFIQQIRKRNIVLLGTTQYSNTIDLRLRQHTDIIAYPNFIEKYPICEVIYMDMTTAEDELYGQIAEPITQKVIYNPLTVYSMFDTEEMIK